MRGCCMERQCMENEKRAREWGKTGRVLYNQSFVYAISLNPLSKFRRQILRDYITCPRSCMKP